MSAGDTSPTGDAGVPITCATLNYNKPSGTTTVMAPPAPTPKGGTIPENVIFKWTAATQYLEAGGAPGGAKQDAYFFSGGHFIQSPSGSGLGTAIIGDYATSGTTLTLTPKTLCNYDGGSTPSTNAPQPKAYSIEGTHFLIHTQYSTGLADMRVVNDSSSNVFRGAVSRGARRLVGTSMASGQCNRHRRRGSEKNGTSRPGGERPSQCDRAGSARRQRASSAPATRRRTRGRCRPARRPAGSGSRVPLPAPASANSSEESRRHGRHVACFEWWRHALTKRST